MLTTFLGLLAHGGRDNGKAKPGVAAVKVKNAEVINGAATFFKFPGILQNKSNILVTAANVVWYVKTVRTLPE